MFDEINNIIDLQHGECMSGWFVGISESSNDGSFLIHHFLSHSLKNSFPVCFVAFNQSFGHYNTVSQRFGTNLNAQKDTNKLVFIEGLKVIGNMLGGNCDKGDNRESFTDTKTLLPNILRLIKTAYDELKQKNKCLPTIIIDDISILISLGVKFTEVIGFCQYLHALTTVTDTGNGGCLVINTNNGQDDDDEKMKTLWNWLCHSCTMTIEVFGLASGYCKDVHGEIYVKNRNTLIKSGKERRMQYKLTDKNITLFAAGMSSAVL